METMSKQHIPTMTPTYVHEYLRKVGRAWSGQGCAMELGCWQGASATPLLEGLVRAGYSFPFWAFDRWNANDEQVQRSKRQGQILYVNQDVKPIFLQNVKRVYGNVRAFKGSLPGTLHNFTNQPIEICIFDAPKMDPVFTNCAARLIPHFIPEVTVWGLLDYKFYQRHEGKRRRNFLAPVRFMERYGDYFELIKQWPDNETASVFFRYVKELKL